MEIHDFGWSRLYLHENRTQNFKGLGGFQNFKKSIFLPI